MKRTSQYWQNYSRVRSSVDQHLSNIYSHAEPDSDILRQSPLSGNPFDVNDTHDVEEACNSHNIHSDTNIRQGDGDESSLRTFTSENETESDDGGPSDGFVSDEAELDNLFSISSDSSSDLGEDETEDRVYLIVEFKNSAEIALVPNNWLLDDNIVKWPPYKTSSRLNNAVVKKEPPSDTWTDQEIERVLYRNESFEKARAKLTQAEVDSDLQSDDCGDKKRKRRAPNRIIDSDDSDESDPEPEPVLKKVVKSPPRLPLSASLTKSPTQSTSSVEMSQLARARDAQFLTLLEKIIAEQKEQRRLLQLIISKGPAVEENSLTLPEGVTFPIKSVDDMDSFNELLQESEVYSRVVKYLSLIGGTTVWETINRLMKEVMSNDIAVLYNVHGKKGKHALYKLRIMDVLYRALQRNPTTKNATRKDMELELRKWLAGARDREGGRKKRADKKNNPLPPPQNHMEHSDTETQNE